MRKQIMMTVMGLAMVLTTTFGMKTYAYADCLNKISLSPTAVGVANDISGNVSFEEKGASQRFKVSMDARVADGTTFVVYVNGMPAGMITITLGSGELDINNHDGAILPAGLDPVCNISSVLVTDGAANPVIEGRF